jgi:glycosyltransferase involved in cell wall biosynthesis
MRVAHIESGRHLYGGPSQVAYLARGLAARGIDNVVICSAGGALAGTLGGADSERDVAGPAGAGTNSGAHFGVHVVTLPMAGDLDAAMLPRLRRALRAAAPDVVHVHSRRGAEIFGAAAATFERLPAVLTRRVDAWEPAFLARLKYRRYARVVAISSAIEQHLLERIGLERARVTRISSAGDTARYAPDPAARARLASVADVTTDAFVVGVVAQLIERKRHALLFAELGALVERHPDVRVLCFGRGPLAEALKRDVAARGLEPHVRFLGFRDDLRHLLPGIDLLVHPAEREGLGVALLEAASAARAVVACAAGGIVDAVEHEVSGLVVPVGDGAALRAAIERLIADPEERRRMGAAGRARAVARFSVDRMVEQHLELYARL